MTNLEEIVYLYENNVYLNITNQCPCHCQFCIRNNGEGLGSAKRLWLEKTPTLEEIKNALGTFEFGAHNKITFCGYGEPTCAFDTLIATSKYIKETFGFQIRVNTNGLSDLINGRPTAKVLCENVDIVSISLNSCSAEKYNRLVRPKFGLCSFEAVLSFAEACKNSGKEVKFTVVDVIPEEDIAACEKIAEEMGIPLRVRHYSD